MEAYLIINFIGRVIFGAYFVWNGAKHFKNVESLSSYAGSQNVPHPRLAVQATGLLILAGGIGVIFGGMLQQIGAVLIAIFLAGVTWKMHAYWKIVDPTTKSAEEIAFWKNVALFGAALYMY